jgi:hypothetical protein
LVASPPRPRQHVDRATLRAALAQLDSSDVSARMTAFSKLLGLQDDQEQGAAEAIAALLREHPSERARVSRALIALLTRENTVRAAGPPRGAEPSPFDFYFDRVVTSVALLYDPEAIPALVEALTPGNYAVDGLAALGPRTIPSLARATTAPDYGARWGAVRALVQLMERTDEFTLSSTDRERIRVAGVGALRDPHEFVRYAAMSLLADFADADTRRAIAPLAESDPDRGVRARAAAWLKRHPEL